MAKLFNRILLGLCIVSCALSMSPTRVLASPVFSLLGDTGDLGGFQAGTIPGGAAAAYFNPALLIDTPAGLSVGFLVLNQQIGISLDGRPGTQFAVPENVASAGHADGKRFDNYPIPTNTLQYGRLRGPRNEPFTARPRQAAGSGHDTKTYEVFGLVVKLFDDHLALGMHALIPNGTFTQMRAFFSDEREQYFTNSLIPELYADRMTAVSLALGAGIKLSDQLSIGVGATLGLKANVTAPTYVADTGNLGNILIDIDATVNVGISPHFGVSYKPTSRLRLAAAVHTPQKVELGTKFTFLLSTGIEQSSGVTLLLDYMPWQVSVGSAYDLIAESAQTLTVSATLKYQRWSDYIDRHGAAPSPAYPWADTLVPAAGLRYRIEKLSTFLDLSYVPTPIPEQTGRTNYVDNDRIAATLGAEYGFRLFGADTKIGAGVQAHRLVPRRQTKLPTPTRPDGAVLVPERVKDELPDDAQLGGDPIPAAQGLQTNNPGWPGFGSTGWIFAANVHFTVQM